MRAMTSIDSFISAFMMLDQEAREALLEQLRKHHNEARRYDILRSAKESMKAYRAGELRPESTEDLIARLEGL